MDLLLHVTEIDILNNSNLDVLDLCQDVCARPLEPLWTTELNCLTLTLVNTLTHLKKIVHCCYFLAHHDEYKKCV